MLAGIEVIKASVGRDDERFAIPMRRQAGDNYGEVEK
jgi:hypothetical protein